MADPLRTGTSRPPSSKSSSTKGSTKTDAVKKKQPQKKSRNRANPKNKTKKAPPTYDPSDLSVPFPTDYYVYCYVNGIYLNCQIKEVAPRTNKKLNVVTANLNNTIPTPYPPEYITYDYQDHQYMYYVHYLCWDVRMDEWVPRDRLRLHQEVRRWYVPNNAIDVAHVPIPSYIAHLLEGNSVKSTATTATYQQLKYDGLLSPQILEFPVVSLPPKTAQKIPSVKVEAVEDALVAMAVYVEDDTHHTYIKNINEVFINKYAMPAWYYSPVPEETTITRQLFFCDMCLSFFATVSELDRHQRRCPHTSPPGKQIYLSSEENIEISVYEIDGAKEKVYCENISYLAKFFLDHKTLWEDTSIFLYYVLCKRTPRGDSILGYFSKEKEWAVNNLACILTLPCYQKIGVGKFLISFSYTLSSMYEFKLGGPERPISDLGLLSYRSYWFDKVFAVLDYLITDRPLTKNMFDNVNLGHGIMAATDDLKLDVSLSELEKMTMLHEPDVTDALKYYKVLVRVAGRWVLSLSELKEQAVRRQTKYNNVMNKIKMSKGQDELAVYIRPTQYTRVRWIPFTGRKRRGQEEIVGIP